MLAPKVSDYADYVTANKATELLEETGNVDPSNDARVITDPAGIRAFMYWRNNFAELERKIEPFMHLKH